MDALAPGTILSGKIRVERTLGQGTMGIVLECTELALQRRVAVKVLAPERAKSEDAKKRFLREARAAARLSSEHVPRLIDVGEFHDGTPYLVMEYLVGSTLEALLVKDGPPSVDTALDWVLQALDGVAEAHRAGLVHRDIKPENLFLAEREGRSPIVKVLDFGTVKDLVTKSTKLTRTGSTMGSPAYMPPEQVRAEEIDPRADVWAMGVTLYELLTGHLPFGGESISETLSAILRDEPRPALKYRPDCPPEVLSVVLTSLSKDRSRRYASANELRAALAAVRARIPATNRSTRTMRMGDATPFRLSRPDELAATTDFSRLTDAHVQEASRVRPRIVVREPAAATIVDQPLVRSPVRTGLLIGASIGAALVGIVAGTWSLLHRSNADHAPTTAVSSASSPAALPPAPPPSSR